MIKLRKERGQAFSTFQLLIAAVVALALLAVLLPLLKSPNIGNSPTKLTQDLLKAQVNNIGTLSYTQKVKIPPKFTMAVSGITQNTGIDIDQVKIIVPTELENNNTFEVLNNKVLKYDKSTKGTYIIGILCNYKSEISEDLTNTYNKEISSDATENLFDSSNDTEDLIVCVIFPKRTS